MLRPAFRYGIFANYRRNGLRNILYSYASHELRIGFQCKGSCKGPYTLKAVSDHNARYNETLNSFFINTTMIKAKWPMEPPL